MSYRTFETGNKARKKLLDGVEKLYQAVSITLGPGGKNVILKRVGGFPEITKDGVTVARELTLEDPYENTGVMAAKQASMKANELAGDGSTSACVLTWELLKSGIDLVESNSNPHLLRKGMNAALKDISSKLAEMSTKITTADGDKLEKVATISGNDPEVGKLVSEAYVKAGDGGFVSYEGSDTGESYVETTSGLKIQGGYQSPYFCTNPIKRTVEFDDPLIFVINELISNPTDFIGFLDNVVSYVGLNPDGTFIRPIVIISKGVEGDAMKCAISNVVERKIRLATLVPKAIGLTNDDLYNDIATFCGTKFVPQGIQPDVSKLDVSMIMGTAKRVTISDMETTLVLDPKNQESLYLYLEELAQQEETSKRIANLKAQVAMVKIGAPTYSAAKELKDRIEDAVNACKSALEDGIVPGGGISLIRANHLIKKDQEWAVGTSDDFKEGYNLVMNSCTSPLLKMIENTGLLIHMVDILNLVNREDADNLTFDGFTGQVVDANEAGILDPVKVIRSSLEAAVSIAGLYLTTDCVMVEHPDFPQG